MCQDSKSSWGNPSAGSSPASGTESLGNALFSSVFLCCRMPSPFFNDVPSSPESGRRRRQPHLFECLRVRGKVMGRLGFQSTFDQTQQCFLECDGGGQALLHSQTQTVRIAGHDAVRNVVQVVEHELQCGNASASVFGQQPLTHHTPKTIVQSGLIRCEPKPSP